MTRRLRGAGFTEQQAEGTADTLAKDALTDLVTKADLAEATTKTEVSLKNLEITLTIRMAVIVAAAFAALAAYLKH